jgi:hypothetical protein
MRAHRFLTQQQRAGSEWARTAQHGVAELFERQPMLLGAVGLAIGAGIAASLPRTETETRLLGGASEALKEKAQELISDKADLAKTMAQRALQEVQVQGQTGPAAGDTLPGPENRRG